MALDEKQYVTKDISDFNREKRIIKPNTIAEKYIIEDISNYFRAILDAKFGIDKWYLDYKIIHRYPDLGQLPKEMLVDVYDYGNGVVGKLTFTNRFIVEEDMIGRYIEPKPEHITKLEVYDETT